MDLDPTMLSIRQTQNKKPVLLQKIYHLCLLTVVWYEALKHYIC